MIMETPEQTMLRLEREATPKDSSAFVCTTCGWVRRIPNSGILDGCVFYVQCSVCENAGRVNRIFSK